MGLELPNIGNIFKKGIDGFLKGGADIVDRFVQTKDEKAAMNLELQKLAESHFQSVQADATHQLELVLADKQSARDMYKANSSLQKIYALVYLGIYVILSCIILYEIFTPVALNIPSWGVQFIATLFGGMTMKLGTITDFLFGSGMDTTKRA